METIDPRLIYITLGFLLSYLLPPVLSFLHAKLNSKINESELYSPTDSILLNVELKSRWMNMGYWNEGETVFSSACEALAREVGNLAEIKKGDRILVNVGFGCGDSLRLWAEEYGPISIVGITSLKSQLKVAASLPYSNMTLQQGDGASLTHLPPTSFDSVLSLDAAYHFSPRTAFVSGAYRALKPGGRLALTDLIMEESIPFFDRFLLRIIFHFAQVPKENMVDLPEYIKRLARAGFEDIEVRDISDKVYPGLINFIERREQEEIARVFNKEWKSMMMYCKVLRWWSGIEGGKRKLKFVLVGARKSDYRPGHTEVIY